MSMQTIYTYSYNPAISTGTNTTGTVWRMGYQQPIELYKGTSNQIKIVVFNPAKKVLNLSGYNIEVQIVDTTNKTYHITKNAVITDPTTGVATVTFTEADLSSLDCRFYDLIARLVDIPDFSTILETQILYLDDNFGAFTPVKVSDAWNFNEAVPISPDVYTNTINGNINPSFTDTYTLGNATLRWDHIYANIADIGNINISTSNISTEGTTLSFRANSHGFTFTDVAGPNVESGTGSIFKFDETQHGEGPTFETWYGNALTPWDPVGQHSLDIRAANPNSYVELASYDWGSYVSVNNNGVQVFTNWNVEPENFWSFNANGWLKLPDNGKLISSSGNTTIQMGYDDIRINTLDIDGSTYHTTIFDKTGDLYVSGNLLPGGLDTGPAPMNSIGSSAHPWKDLYISNNTIYMNNIPLSIDGSGNLTVNGNSVTVKEIPQVPINSPTLLTAEHSGKHFYETSGEGTVIQVPHSYDANLKLGTTVTIITTTGTVWVSPQASTEPDVSPAYPIIYGVGVEGTGYWGIPARSVATLIKVEQDVWYLSGYGIFLD